MPRKHTRLNGRNLTVECPTCNMPYFMHRSEWLSKRPGSTLGCRGCGTHVPSREWRLLSVPWLRVVA